MVPTKSRVCQTTQNIPAPQGPRQRAACHTRFATAPAEPSHKQRKAIPVESFADVLSHPAYYCEMYPDTLPLTRELCQQLRAANVARAGGGEPAVTQVSPPDSVASLSPREELAMDSDDIVEGISRRSLSQAPPPIGKERQTVRINPFQETGHGSAMTHHSVKLGGYDSPTTLDDSFYDEAGTQPQRSTLDMLECGELFQQDAVDDDAAVDDITAILKGDFTPWTGVLGPMPMDGDM